MNIYRGDVANGLSESVAKVYSWHLSFKCKSYSLIVKMLK